MSGNQLQEVKQAERLDKLRLLVKDYGPAVPAPIGAVLLALGLALAPLPGYSEWWWMCAGLGGLLLLLSAFSSFKQAERTSVLRRKVSEFERQLEVEKDQKRVFVVAYSFNDEWMREVVHTILNSFSSEGMRPTLYVTTENFGSGNQVRYFREVIQNSRYFIGGIVIPLFPERHIADIKRFADQLKKPLVFVDHSPYAADDQRPPYVATALVDPNIGGQFAADYIADLDLPDRLSRILVLCGETQVGRQHAFSIRIRERISGCQIDLQDGQFDREASRRITKRIVEKGIRASDPVGAIFCTSEVMTLGCLDGLKEIPSINGKQLPFVVGYDGTSRLKIIAEQEDSRLWQVIGQDPAAIGTEAVNLLSRLVAGERDIEDYQMMPYRFFESPI